MQAKYQGFAEETAYSMSFLLVFAAVVCLIIVAIIRPRSTSHEVWRVSIEVKGVSKLFGDFVALDDVSVSLPTGQLTALLGPSGGGKSTLLRIIAGLDSADSGSVVIEGTEATTCRRRSATWVRVPALRGVQAH